MTDIYKLASDPNVLSTKFYILTFNSWVISDFDEAYPAEIALIEFSLEVFYVNNVTTLGLEFKERKCTTILTKTSNYLE